MTPLVVGILIGFAIALTSYAAACSMPETL